MLQLYLFHGCIMSKQHIHTQNHAFFMFDKFEPWQIPFFFGLADTYTFSQFQCFLGPCRNSLALVPGLADALRGKPRVSQWRCGCLRSKQSLESGRDPTANVGPPHYFALVIS